MRIIAGKWRGRKLEAPNGSGKVRPTSDRVRESLFSMLTSRIGSFEGLRVADIFAGTGALGLEALSRGADHCTFVDSDAEFVRRNVARFDANADIVGWSFGRYTHRGPAFDLVFMDPPYHLRFVPRALQELALTKAIEHGAWLAVETAHGEIVAETGYIVDAERVIARTRLTLLRFVGDQSEAAVSSSTDN